MIKSFVSIIVTIVLCGMSHSVCAEPKSDLRDRSVREVVFAVAKMQMRPLAEGEWKQGTEQESMDSKHSTGTKWNYPWGVTLYGLLRLSEVSGDKTFSSYVLQHNNLVAKDYEYIKWREQTFGKRGEVKQYHQLFRLICLDDCGSMANEWVAGLMASGAQTPPGMFKLPALCADYISKKQSRYSDGTLCRGKSLWADDLYMSCPFLARWSAYTFDDKYITDAAQQIINQAKRLQDKDGLWYHGWYDQQKTPSFKWGRSNGWSIVAQIEVLSYLSEKHPDRDKLLTILRKHIDGLKRVQSPSGMWRQLLDRPDYWEETSCTAMFTYAIARACNRGWIPKKNLKVAEKGFRALKTRIALDGTVIGTCVGTNIGTSLDYYFTRAQPVDDEHGHGAILLAGAELIAAGM